ncbi:glycosyltransferase family 4 protein [Ferruginibacter paludis]|uniref:glycosyltransferase family 4 protein n=1 Tax=Ferruginibacter paludis TaxID=1310417 RepID=UPI0025B5D0EB|nr:glycosyltransferase family 4 protein [Ferruginibacter paludis]MDN3655843.1 glycosyltransferase family 4 protein [Ferruginibacter paludis]
MKVLILIPGLPVNINDIKGGVNSALINLLTGFSKKMVTVRVLSFNRDMTSVSLTQFSPNVEIYYIPESGLPHVFNFAFNGSRVVRRHIKEFNPDVVHFAMSGYILLTGLFGLRKKHALVTIHGIAFKEARQKERLREKLVWYSNGLVELLLRPANIIHLSNYSYSLLPASKKGCVTIIPNAVNPVFFDLPLKTATDSRIIYAGSIDANKNIIFLLKTLSSLKAKNIFYFLNVVGDFTDDHYKKEVLDYISNNQLEQNVMFHGWLSQENFQRELVKCDILMVSSRQESLPMVIAEAMSAGKVVVSSITGGTPEMITDRMNGFLFDLNQPEMAIDILERLYNNNQLMQTIQLAAKQTAVSVYHCGSVADRTIEFYRSLHNKHRN